MLVLKVSFFSVCFDIKLKWQSKFARDSISDKYGIPGLSWLCLAWSRHSENYQTVSVSMVPLCSIMGPIPEASLSKHMGKLRPRGGLLPEWSFKATASKPSSLLLGLIAFQWLTTIRQIFREMSNWVYRAVAWLKNLIGHFFSCLI